MLVPACASVAVPTPYRVAGRLRDWLALTSMLTRVVRALQVQGQPVRGYRRTARVCPTMDLEPPACRPAVRRKSSGERYVLAFRSKSMNSAASSGLANMMVRSSSWIMRP